MDTNEIKKLCLKHVYGATLTSAEQALVDNYAQTADGHDYLHECRETKDLLMNVADVKIKPADHEAMVENFERTVRQSFNKTVLRPWWQANSPPIVLGILVGLLVVFRGWNIIDGVLLGICFLWLIADVFQRHYITKILSKPDLYEYAKASRKRSDRILRSLPGLVLAVVFSTLVIAAVSYGAYWGYQKFGFIAPAIVIFVLVETGIIVVYQFRKQKRSDREVWDWWAEEIKE